MGLIAKSPVGGNLRKRRKNKQICT